MASPREIQDASDRRDVAAALALDAEDPPHGFVRIDGKMRAVWLAPDTTPEGLGLGTWSPTRRWLR